ncbi:MAG TPA: efflux RND transporter periplasmic adaptor subunit [Gemmatimonadaceae bacterium]|nr:efflux RND transporter periplasmic adaptor subunit [Gemmatimonadaceae bacterium]
MSFRRSLPVAHRRPLTAALRGAVLLLALTAAVACTKPAPPQRSPVAVVVAVAERGAAPYIVTANGIVEPMQTVAVQSQVGGVLNAVRFKEGDDVIAGQLLFEIDPRPFKAALDQARAVLARDEAQSENARRDADRYAALVQKDFVTKSQADQAAANAIAQKQVVEADRAAVANMQFNLDNATIRAPISGRTGSLLVKQGNLVKPGSAPPLVIINQIHPILVRFTVPEGELDKVQKYYAVNRSLKVLATPRGDPVPVAGSMSFLDNGVDTTTGTVTLKAKFANADNRLWPGQFVAAALELFVDTAAILVPSAAVQNGQEGLFVFVIDTNGKANMRQVSVGRTVGDRIVIEKGLDAGTRVVTDGQSRITPGASVEIKASGPATPTAGARAGGGK